MTRTLLDPTETGPPASFYRKGVQTGNRVFVSGQVSRDERGDTAGAGELVGRGDPEAQAEQAVRYLAQVLEAAGGSPGDVVYLCNYVTHPAYVEAVRAARRAHAFTRLPGAEVVEGLAREAG
jgi:enamine deaminase RidA (YjgF/YER057c/UK114 family)